MEGEGTQWMFVVFKALLGFGVPLALGLQQLISIKRQIRADRAAAAAATEAASTEGGTAREGEVETRERVPEPA